VIARGRYRGGAAGVRVLSGLLVPADPVREVFMVVVADTSAAISDALGGVLLDDAVTWAASGGAWVSAYLGEARAHERDNPRLSVIATRLGLVDRAFHTAARGDALIVGSLPTGVDVDLPARVVAEAARTGIPVQLAPAPVLAGAGPAVR